MGKGEIRPKLRPWVRGRGREREKGKERGAYQGLGAAASSRIKIKATRPSRHRNLTLTNPITIDYVCAVGQPKR